MCLRFLSNFCIYFVFKVFDKIQCVLMKAVSRNPVMTTTVCGDKEKLMTISDEVEQMCSQQGFTMFANDVSDIPQ